MRSLLTSSHSNQPAEADWISWCLSRDRNCQRRDDPKVIARTPPPAFLFPNQRCQRPEPACRPHRLAPGVGGGGYLVAPVFRVNRLFRAFFSLPGGPGFEERSATAKAGSERKNHCGLPRGFPHRSVAIRLKDRRLCGDDEKIKGLFEPLVFVAAPFPAGERRIYWPPPAVSIDLPMFLRNSSRSRSGAKAKASPPER